MAVWACMFICLRKCKCASLLKRSVTFSLIGLIMIFQCCFAVCASMKVISQVSTGKLAVILQKLGWVHRPLDDFLLLLLLFVFCYLQLLLYPELNWAWMQFIQVCFRLIFLLNIYQWRQQKEMNFPFHMWIVSRIVCIICLREMCEALAVELVFWKERVVLD